MVHVHVRIICYFMLLFVGFTLLSNNIRLQLGSSGTGNFRLGPYCSVGLSSPAIVWMIGLARPMLLCEITIIPTMALEGIARGRVRHTVYRQYKM